MKIMQLKREDIYTVTRGIGGTSLLEKEVTEQLDLVELHGNVLYVRYAPMFLQRLEVSGQLHLTPEVQERLTDESFWNNQQNPPVAECED